MKHTLALLLAATASTLSAAEFINGPVVRKIVVNERPIEGRATWKVTGLGVFTCYVNGHEVGAADWLKPGWTDVTKRRAAYTYDVTDFLNKEVGSTNVLSAIVTKGWWSDGIMGKFGGEGTGFWGELREEGKRKKEKGKSAELETSFLIDETGTGWECCAESPVDAGIWEGERCDASVGADVLGGPCGARGASALPEIWQPATLNTSFTGVVEDVRGAQVVALAPLPVVKTWRVGNKTIYDFGQNHAGVPHFTLRGKPGATFRYRLGEILNDGVKGHHGDGPKDTVYLANLRGAATNMWYRFEGKSKNEKGKSVVVDYTPKYSFYGYRYLQLEDDPDVELVKVESIPLSSVTPALERGSLTVGNADLNRLVENVRWGMRSNYLSVPTDCPQRTERLGWSADTQVFAETALYFADVSAFLGKWMQDYRDVQAANGSFPDVAPRAAFGWQKGGQAAWSDAGIVVPYRVWKAMGDTAIVRENWESMMAFLAFMDKTNYEKKEGEWLLCDWLSYEKLTVDNRTRWSNHTFTLDHLSYQNFLNACYAVSDCQMMREMAAPVDAASRRVTDLATIEALESKFRAKIAERWLTEGGALIPLFDGMMTPRLMAIKVGAGDVERHRRELVDIIRKNGNRLATGFVGTSELTEQLSRVGACGVVWDILLNHAFPGWLYSVDQGATTIWERWNGYTKDKGFGDVGMNSYNHYAYGSVVGWLFKYAAGIQPGGHAGRVPLPGNGGRGATALPGAGYKVFVLAPHPDPRAGSLAATYETPYGDIRSAWWYVGEKCVWMFTIPEGTTAEVHVPGGAVETLSAGSYEARDGVVTAITARRSRSERPTTPNGTTPNGTTPNGTTPNGTTPNGTTPIELIAEQLLSTDPMAYKPVGCTSKAYGGGQLIHYATVSLAVNALEDAHLMGDTNLEARLIAQLRPYCATAADLGAGAPSPPQTAMNDFRHVDLEIVGALPLELAILTGDKEMAALGLKYADRQWEAPREGRDWGDRWYDPIPLATRQANFDAGYSPETRLWIDDMYMITLLQSQAYRLTGEVKYIERAAKEMCHYLEKLQRDDGLFNHGPDVPFVWGRGAGWMAAGMTLNLKYLPEDSPYRAPILAGYRKMMTSLLQGQRASGLWGQLVNDPESFEETSGSAMFAYAFAEGVKNGWLDRATYQPAVEKATDALLAQLDEHGNLKKVCVGTGKRNDRTWYLTRPVCTGDPHGQAPMLWLLGALMHVEEASSPPQKEEF